MATRLVIDPITRIEGHLRIEAEVDSANKVSKAYSSGTMVRGIEIILKGRDPARSLGFRAARLRRLHHSALLRPPSVQLKTRWASRFPKPPI